MHVRYPKKKNQQYIKVVSHWKMGQTIWRILSLTLSLSQYAPFTLNRMSTLVFTVTDNKRLIKRLPQKLTNEGKLS